MKRLLLVLVLVAGCGYRPGSADDPSATPSATPSLVAVCNIRDDGPPTCEAPAPADCGQPDCNAGSGYVDPTPTAVPEPAPGGGGGGGAAPNPAPASTLSGACSMTYAAPTMNVAVFALIGHQIVPGASVTVQVTGTIAGAPVPPSTVFTGTTDAANERAPSVTVHYLGGSPSVPIFAVGFPLPGVPNPTYDSSGHQLPNQIYASYRCHGTVSLNGSTDSF